jgi:hypothetical protein
MAINLSSLRRTAVKRPPRIFLYGAEGTGKSSFAANSPNCVFLQTEDGLDAIEAQSFGLARSFSDLMDAIGALAEEEHQFSTVALDSVDWAEQLIFKDVCQEAKVANISEIGFGKGFVAALSRWSMLLEGLDILRNERNMAVILIGHARIKKFDDPTTESYDRWEPDLHASASSTLCEWSDIVSFVNFRVAVRTQDAGFNRKISKGTGNGTRTMYLESRPAFTAKSRWRIGTDCPLDWATFAARLEKAQGGQDAAPVEDAEPVAEAAPVEKPKKGGAKQAA